MKNIVVPTDFSENALHALRYAANLAGRLGGKILLFHNADATIDYTGNTMPPAGDMIFGTVPVYGGVSTFSPELEQIYEEKLEELAASLRSETQNTLEVDTLTKWGSLTDNLNDLLHNGQADLVVMGTKGATSFLDRLIGTNTASVLQDVHGPVLAVPAQAVIGLPRHIAYAAELEDEETAYLQQVLAFAGQVGAATTLVHVKSDTQLDIVNNEQVLADLTQRFPNQQLELREISGHSVADGLTQFVQQGGADMVAVGIHERSFMAGLFHSSVTKDLAFHLDVPLLALHQQQARTV